ncbi:MAG: hypothetical protein OEW33_00720 [Nitrospirota bacterium]|nr:hypothetical protein [Nitrospirota bacterium]
MGKLFDGTPIQGTTQIPSVLFSERKYGENEGKSGKERQMRKATLAGGKGGLLCSFLP